MCKCEAICYWEINAEVAISMVHIGRGKYTMCITESMKSHLLHKYVFPIKMLAILIRF